MDQPRTPLSVIKEALADAETRFFLRKKRCQLKLNEAGVAEDRQVDFARAVVSSLARTNFGWIADCDDHFEYDAYAVTLSAAFLQQHEIDVRKTTWYVGIQFKEDTNGSIIAVVSLHRLEKVFHYANGSTPLKPAW